MDLHFVSAVTDICHLINVIVWAGGAMKFFHLIHVLNLSECSPMIDLCLIPVQLPLVSVGLECFRPCIAESSPHHTMH